MSMFWNCLIEEMYVEFSLLWELYLGYHVSSCASSVNISVTSKLDSALANHYSSMDISNFCINWMLRSQLLYNPPSWKHVDSWLLLLYFYVESSFWIRERKSCFFVPFFASPLGLTHWMVYSYLTSSLLPHYLLPGHHFAEVAYSNLQNIFIEKGTNTCCSILLLSWKGFLFLVSRAKM